MSGCDVWTRFAIVSSILAVTSCFSLTTTFASLAEQTSRVAGPKALVIKDHRLPWFLSVVELRPQFWPLFLIQIPPPFVNTLEDTVNNLYCVATSDRRRPRRHMLRCWDMEFANTSVESIIRGVWLAPPLFGNRIPWCKKDKWVKFAQTQL